MKIGFDLAPAKSILNEHIVEIEKLQNFQQNQYGRLESLFKRAGVYPKWAIIIFIVSMLFSLVSILYAYHTKSNSSKVEQIGFEKGVAEYDNHIEAFFSENEKARKEYEIWKNQELNK
ncbi:hypothetical protein UMM65_13685 [Aureibaculum sp. 2210JD6-5]|nr:hypothetical protein [Aureibaculum sp. 2210JD6-5]MDY7396297.1 hypothetical protein [Aureibaculum sp. 2210JD6-5]